MILESLMAVVSGGATGILGSLISDVSSHFKDKAMYAYKLKQGDLDIRLLKAKTDASVMIARTEQETAKVEGVINIQRDEMASFKESQESDSGILKALAAAKQSSTLLNLAAFIRTMVRPLLTSYLCFVTTLMYIDARNFMEGVDLLMVSAQAMQVYGDVTTNVLYLTAAAVLFWFGQRKRPVETNI